MNNTRNPIPVAVITGFLGAGKTTLLNHILRNTKHHKFVVIENEIGDIAIDKQLVVNVANDAIFELADGCICCSLNDELLEVLDDILRGNHDFDYLLIETTGIADPASIVQSFIANEEIKCNYVLDNVICLADAPNLIQTLDEHPEAYKQLVFADTVVLNKTDMVSEQIRKELQETIEQLAPAANIFQAKNAQLDLDKLIDTETHSFEHIALQTMKLQQQQHHHHKHDQLNTLSFNIAGNLDPQKFETWLKYFLYINKSAIFRAKGIVSFPDEPQKYVFQAVRDAFTFEKTDYWLPREKRENTIVFIGRNILAKDIEESLNALIVDDFDISSEGIDEQ